jgi:inner membrane protein involved in colicin E2 resistance
MQLSDVVNTELLSHPYNYLIVGLTLVLLVMFLCLIAGPLGQQISGLTSIV